MKNRYSKHLLTIAARDEFSPEIVAVARYWPLHQ